MTLMVVNAIIYGVMVLLGITVGAHAYRFGQWRAVYGVAALFIALQILITAGRAAWP